MATYENNTNHRLRGNLKRWVIGAAAIAGTVAAGAMAVAADPEEAVITSMDKLKEVAEANGWEEQWEMLKAKYEK